MHVSVRHALALEIPVGDDDFGAGRQTADFLGDHGSLRGGAFVGLSFQDVELLFAMSPAAKFALSFAGTHAMIPLQDRSRLRAALQAALGGGQTGLVTRPVKSVNVAGQASGPRSGVPKRIQRRTRDKVPHRTSVQAIRRRKASKSAAKRAARPYEIPSFPAFVTAAFDRR